ncbi:MAG: AAA family ATPase [Armatimonadetes bacterium]|nr:AAA family ATPase [Armatimonadota bacterium]
MCRGENRYPFKTGLTHGYFVVGYGASRRLANSVSIQSSNLFNMPEARQVATLFSSDATLNPLESWAMELDYTDPENGLKRLREHLANLLPDVEFLRIDKSTKHLVFRTPDGEIRLDQLSDGFQNMLSWIGDLLYCHSESVFAQIPLSDLYGLLLLDEMELHLHPKWQRALRAYLDEKLPNFQIIATTHSPITAQQAQEDELYYMERESPTSPPKLHKYRGNPSQLMIHQMLNNPAFGNPTIDSYQVEQKRKEYIRLNTKPTRTPRENAKLKALNQELGDLPTISMSGQDDDNSVMSLLRKIETAL